MLVAPALAGLGPFTFDGRPCHRAGSTTTVLPRKRYEERILQNVHPQHRWETMEAHQVSIDELDANEILRTVRLGIESTVAAGKPEPEFAQIAGCTVVTFRFARSLTPQVTGEVADEVTGEVRKLLGVLVTGSLGRAEAQSALQLQSQANFRDRYLLPALEAGLKATVAALHEEIRDLYAADDVPWSIGYSGGKDSTATLQLNLGGRRRTAGRAADQVRARDFHKVFDVVSVQNGPGFPLAGAQACPALKNFHFTEARLDVR